MTAGLVAALVALTTAGRPALPHSGDPCTDACAMARMACDDQCAHPDKYLKDEPKKSSRRAGEIEIVEGDGEGPQAMVSKEALRNPKACKKACDEQVQGCQRSCPAMLGASDTPVPQVQDAPADAAPARSKKKSKR